MRNEQQPSLISARFSATLLVAGLCVMAGCASSKPAPAPPKIVYESGLNMVHLEQDPDSTANSHPVTVSPNEVGTLLRGVRAWERRNVIHRLFAGKADRTRAFRDNEIAVLAPALSKALAEASPAERVFFHLSSPTEDGLEETTTGWLSVRDQLLYLSLSEVHDKHGPGPDISKYDRQMPNVPQVSPEFDVIFEPEEYLDQVKSAGRWFAPDQREELQIRYRDALAAMPVYPINKDQGARKDLQP
jgi:hypothetical protein